MTLNGQAATGGTVSNSNTANWSRAVTLSSGANTISVEATDGAGNSNMQQITLNLNLPVAPVTGADLEHRKPGGRGDDDYVHRQRVRWGGPATVQVPGCAGWWLGADGAELEHHVDLRLDAVDGRELHGECVGTERRRDE